MPTSGTSRFKRRVASRVDAIDPAHETNGRQVEDGGWRGRSIGGGSSPSGTRVRRTSPSLTPPERPGPQPAYGSCFHEPPGTTESRSAGLARHTPPTAACASPSACTTHPGVRSVKHACPERLRHRSSRRRPSGRRTSSRNGQEETASPPLPVS